MDDATEYKRRTMEAYDALASELAEGYDHHFETYAQVEAEHLLAKLSKGCKILDLGCGVGAASRYFAERGYQPIGADLSEEMVKVCQRRGLTNLVRLDLEALPFLNSSFDGIWAHTSLLHIPKHRLANVLGSLDKILTPRGALFIALREGGKEGYEEQSGTERWFAYYQANEFEGYIPEGYSIERFTRIDRQSVTFLNYHLVRGGE
ncbi:MAG TPA: class I SAM-dependent methyltransferase [Anaerolineales bacterium]|nr:class I SAM-dependent methyltransferase [Anaerolineales bacterium]HLO29329.1 class I SAM-dependent methyltransferase [Anaerolineales bacterium]